MFAKAAVALISLSALSAAVPVKHIARGFSSGSSFSGSGFSGSSYYQPSHDSVSHSLSGWGGYHSLDGFDDFYGSQNFDSSRNTRHILINKDRLVCHTREVEVIQQKLVVLQELAKKIITEQICEVETQTIVLEQWRSSIRGFHYDLGRQDGRVPGYDSNIVSKYNDLFEDDGSLSTHDLGFKGSDVGSNFVTVDGSNWQDSSSPASVDAAFKAAESARDGTSALPPISQDSNNDNTNDDVPDGDNTAIPSAAADPAADPASTADPASATNPPADDPSSASVDAPASTTA